MKILILNPPTLDNKKFIREGRCTQEQNFWATLWPPISLAYIGAVLENGGHTIKIVDCAAENINVDKIGALIHDFCPNLILWSTGTPSIKSDLQLSAFIKRANPLLKTVVFGVHVSIFPRESLENYRDLDFVIRNEPEITAKDLVYALEGGIAVKQIKGLTYRDANGEIISNPDREFIQDLDVLPFPAWHLINPSSYQLPLKKRKFLLVLPSRGCPYQCTFCTSQKYYGIKARYRSTEKVIEELEYNIAEFGVKDFFFWSETFTLNKDYIDNLCNSIINKRMDISWTCNSRVDTVNETLLKKMSDAGCWMISFGIESGSQKILDMAKKGTEVSQAIDAVRLAKKNGLKVIGHFILGLPGETPETLQETINFSKSLDLDFAQYYCAVPFPGSELYQIADSEGLLKNKDFDNFSQNYPVLELPNLSASQVMEYKNRAYKEFYFNPKTILKGTQIVNFRSINSITQCLKYLFNLVSK
jgi:anaerobic magnesium-protoporphyrin IX monomethyl ester cyclase